MTPNPMPVALSATVAIRWHGLDPAAAAHLAFQHRQVTTALLIRRRAMERSGRSASFTWV